MFTISFSTTQQSPGRETQNIALLYHRHALYISPTCRFKIINYIFLGKTPSFSSGRIRDAHTTYGIRSLAAFAHTVSKNHLGLILLSIQKHTHILTAQFHGFGEQEWLLFSLADSCRAIHSRKDRERQTEIKTMYWYTYICI